LQTESEQIGSFSVVARYNCTFDLESKAGAGHYLRSKPEEARMQIDLNSDLGEGFGDWRMGDDAAILALVTSANVACGGHASDPDTMVETLSLARDKGVRVGAHPGYADPLGFGRRVIPMTPLQIERMVAVQIGALIGAAALAGVQVAYVKAHGALANLAADERAVADAIARATRAISPDLALLAISGTELETAGIAAGLATYSEVFADRAYLPNGRLVPRSQTGAMLTDAGMATTRLLRLLETGMMPVLGGGEVALRAQSICVHGDSAHAVGMAKSIRQGLTAAGVTLVPFA
jgi:5-oxoprolinase (ATP-hydrolysing) subunit A